MRKRNPQRGKARVRPVAGQMNKNEQLYAAHLAVRLRCGEIVRWDYEPETFKLGNACRYTPDFRVVLLDGTVEFHDAKGCKMKAGANGVYRATAWMEEDARVKLRVAPRLHPYTFRVVFKKPDKYGGEWILEEM